jgi:hypothetical protein
LFTEGNDSRKMLPKAACAGRLIGAFSLKICVKERPTTMRPWLIMLGPGLALVGLQAAQAQVVIDVTKITCQQFLEDRVTDTTTLSVWLNGYVNGAHGKTNK